MATTTHKMTLAKAKETEIRRFSDILQEINWLSQSFRDVEEIETIDWEEFPIIAKAAQKCTDPAILLKTICYLIGGSPFEKLLWNLEVLLENCADPDLDHLDFNKDIKEGLTLLNSNKDESNRN
ncbi:hypothetical protein D3C79_677530 [compost metagenome]